MDSKGSGFNKSFFNTWCVTRGVMCVLEGFRFFTRIDFSWNLVPLYIIVSKNTISVSDISAVNLIVG